MRGYPVQRRSVFSVSGFGSLAVGRLLATRRLHHCTSRQDNRDVRVKAVASAGLTIQRPHTNAKRGPLCSFFLPSFPILSLFLLFLSLPFLPLPLEVDRLNPASGRGAL